MAVAAITFSGCSRSGSRWVPPAVEEGYLNRTTAEPARGPRQSRSGMRSGGCGRVER